MTANKQFNNRGLEEYVRNIANDMRDVKSMISGMYDRFDDLRDIAEATYKTVAYEQNHSLSPSDADWDILDEE